MAAELAAAKKAGLEAEVEALAPKPEAVESVPMPPAEPTDDEVHGIDVLEIENAVKVLWKNGIYAESAMGCTGPVIKMPGKHVEKAKVLLKDSGYL